MPYCRCCFLYNVVVFDLFVYMLLVGLALTFLFSLWSSSTTIRLHAVRPPHRLLWGARRRISWCRLRTPSPLQVNV